MTSQQPFRDLDHVRLCLLALLTEDPGSSADPAARLDESQWPLLQAMAHQHRLEPKLHEAWRHRRERSGIPAGVLMDWEASFRASAMQALAAQATLIKLGCLLELAQIPYAALKGARLAWHAYAHPALRPMRDIDILVPPDRAGAVYRALVAQGFSPEPGDKTPVDIAIRQHKHLPGLIDAATGIRVEVHLRLFEHIAAAKAGAVLCNPEALLARREWIKLGRQPIACLPSTETLLHLLIHSAYEHRFDNGPQILHDIAALLACEEIDWQRFWILAAEGGWERGCLLLLRATEHFLGPQPVAWSEAGPAAIPAAILNAAALMMLQDTDLRQDLALQTEIAAATRVSWSAGMRLLSRFRAPRHAIAAHAGIATDARWIWRHYPAWLFSRLKRTVSGALNRHQRAEVARAIAIENWLTVC